VIDIIIGDVFFVVARFRATAVVTLRCRTLSPRTASTGWPCGPGLPEGALE
jgi:hypothetical protein